MLTIKDFEENPSHYIWLNDYEINYDSIFVREFNGDLRLLLICVEDNITFNEEGEEEIDYRKAVNDYLYVNLIKNIEKQR